VEAGVFGFVNHAHASAAEFLEDAVVEMVWSITGDRRGGRLILRMGSRRQRMQGVVCAN